MLSLSIYILTYIIVCLDIYFSKVKVNFSNALLEIPDSPYHYSPSQFGVSLDAGVLLVYNSWDLGAGALWFSELQIGLVAPNSLPACCNFLVASKCAILLTLVFTSALVLVLV